MTTHARRTWRLLITVAALSLVLGAAACGDDDDDATADGDDGASGGQIEMTFDEGIDDLTAEVGSCDASDDGSVNLEAEGDGYSIVAEAVGGVGSVVVEGDVSFEGEIESVEVTDDGDITIDGSSLPEEETEASTFELTGSCG